MRSDQRSPKLSRAALIGQLDRRAGFFFTS